MEAKADSSLLTLRSPREGRTVDDFPGLRVPAGARRKATRAGCGLSRSSVPGIGSAIPGTQPERAVIAKLSREGRKMGRSLRDVAAAIGWTEVATERLLEGELDVGHVLRLADGSWVLADRFARDYGWAFGALSKFDRERVDLLRSRLSVV
jgi:hypothetical protein